MASRVDSKNEGVKLNVVQCEKDEPGGFQKAIQGVLLQYQKPLELEFIARLEGEQKKLIEEIGMLEKSVSVLSAEEVNDQGEIEELKKQVQELRIELDEMVKEYNGLCLEYRRDYELYKQKLALPKFYNAE